MGEILLHPTTEAVISRLSLQRPHVVLLTGSTGSGKYSIAKILAGKYLGIHEEQLDAYPQYFLLSSPDGKAISIDTIREMQRELVLKIPGSKGVARVVVIENAHLLTTEAQNALLKTLEEPPLDTALIMTASSSDSLLPTIRSRVHTVPVVLPPAEELAVILAKAYDRKDVDTALLLSGNLPGLAIAILSADTDHPLHLATTESRKLLQSKVYERLLMVEGLSKQKALCQDIVFILGQMARTALERNSQSSNQAAAKRWQNILKASHEADKQLRNNAQAKLVMTNLMFAL